MGTLISAPTVTEQATAGKQTDFMMGTLISTPINWASHCRQTNKTIKTKSWQGGDTRKKKKYKTFLRRKKPQDY